MFKNFFAQDNARLKFATTLIVVASLVTSLAAVPGLPPIVAFLAPIVVAVLTVWNQFFQANRVYNWAVWVALIYTTLDAIVTFMEPYPSTRAVMVSLSAFLKTLAEMSVQKLGDAKPPVAADPQLPPLPTNEVRKS